MSWAWIGVGVVAVAGIFYARENMPKGETTINEIDTRVDQQSTYGAVIPRVYGRVKISGNLFWLKNNKLTIKTTYIENEGGKGDSGGQLVNTAFATFAIGLCIGPAYGIGRIWAADQLIYNMLKDGKARVDADDVFHGTGSVSGTEYTFEMFPGTIDQVVSEDISADLGTSCPRYPMLSYVVFKDFPLESFGNTLQATNFKFELIKLPQDFVPEGGGE